MTTKPHVWKGTATAVVKPGEWWSVGAHRFLCGDLMSDQAGEVLAAGRIDAVYTDPPWTGGEARRFRTLSGVDGGRAAPVDMEEFRARSFDLWRHCAGDVWVAMSSIRDDWNPSIPLSGARLFGRWPARFHERACELLRYRFDNRAPEPRPDLEAGIEIFGNGHKVLAGLPKGATVADFCLGLGSTPIACVRGGWRFVGMELAPIRMEQAMAAVAKLTGERPRRE